MSGGKWNLNIKSHQRVNDILLGPLERPALQWLAAHMPPWINPDVLTGIGIFGSLMIFLGYVASSLDKNFLWLASLGFVVNWFGDSLDGTLARYRNIQRPRYGFFIDHTVDALSEFMVFIGMGLSPYVTLEIACLALIGYLLLSVLAYVRTCVDGVFKISFTKLGPTEMRAIAILSNTVIYFIGNPTIDLPVGALTVYDLIVSIIAVVLISAFVVSTIQQARQLAKLNE
ncbi:MAG: CDP-alcohol phosphatidyltransferase family protein [Anaerolineae bacterium]|nr:CDP-alcohol phosphatidyltransferase family protein [Anaerolineae bacterium]